MNKNYTLLFPFLFIFFLISCKKEFNTDDFHAYFGGEIENPNSKYVLFMQGEKVIDTILLDENNRFLHKFDSLKPGLYKFIHDPEYQYIYFDKNDSLMIQLNTEEFDNSLVFCGRGDEKNNFLIEQYLKNEECDNKSYNLFEKNISEFLKINEKDSKINNTFYSRKKEIAKWNPKFDSLAKISFELHNALNKEIYPIAHEYRTGNKIIDKLPKNYFNHRKKIDLNNESFQNFSPFVKYTTSMLTNMVYEKTKSFENENSIENNILRLKIVDTLFKNQKVKNVVINNIAHMYLLSDQCTTNNTKFFQLYSKLVTDKELKNEILNIHKAINSLKPNTFLPETNFIDITGKEFNLRNHCSKQTILFFWTKLTLQHAKEIHKKATELKKNNPNVEIISINIGNTSREWINMINEHHFKDVTHIHALNYNEIRSKWVINKIYRTIILNPNGSIKNAFVNIYDSDFEKQLK